MPEDRHPPQIELYRWCERRVRQLQGWLGPTAAEVVARQGADCARRQRRLERELERRRAELEPLRQELAARRHELAARREARGRLRSACAERLGDVMRSAQDALQTDNSRAFGDRIAGVLAKLLLEAEEDTVLLDPSRSMTEQLRQRWLAGYDEAEEGCRALRAEVEELEEQARRAEVEASSLEGALREAGDTAEQLQNLSRTLRRQAADDPAAGAGAGAGAGGAAAAV